MAHFGQSDDPETQSLSLDPTQLDAYVSKSVDMVAEFVPRLALALLTLMVGFWIVRGVGGLVRRVAEKRSLDPTLTPFLVNLATWGLRVAVLISAASIVGVETTSFVAVLGAASLAVGLALQGSLSNFAGGALILIFRPYRVGDVIEAQGHIGAVKEIQIFTTILVNGQNRRIILPNGPVANGSIINYTVEGRARVDLVVGIAYDADIDKARSVIMDVLRSDERVLTDPEPAVEVLELGDSSVNLAVRPHVDVADYWGVHFDTLRRVKVALDGAGIGIPFPQRDVHVYRHDA